MLGRFGSPTLSGIGFLRLFLDSFISCAFLGGVFLSALFGSVLTGAFFGGGFFVSEIGLILLQAFNVVFLLVRKQLQRSFGGVDFMSRFVQTLLGVLNAAFLGGESRFLVIAAATREPAG